jgi:hypothetical protein
MAIVLLLLVSGGVAQGQSEIGGRKAKPATPAHPAPAPAPSCNTAELQDLLHQLADAQKWAGEQVWHVKEAVDGLPGKFAEIQDGHADLHDDVDKLREEVKGLYVELSSLRQQLEAIRGDVGGVDSNVSAFRTFSGFFIAAMILLLAVIAVMTIRR